MSKLWFNVSGRGAPQLVKDPEPLEGAMAGGLPLAVGFLLSWWRVLSEIYRGCDLTPDYS